MSIHVRKGCFTRGAIKYDDAYLLLKVTGKVGGSDFMFLFGFDSRAPNMFIAVSCAESGDLCQEH